MMNNDVPEFAIFQNSRTRRSAIWTKHNGWEDAPDKDYEHLGLLASLLRTSPNPSKILEGLADQIRKNKDEGNDSFGPSDWDLA
jgi:hypothetical protein